jgi:hypothetical protein
MRSLICVEAVSALHCKDQDGHPFDTSYIALMLTVSPRLGTHDHMSGATQKGPVQETPFIVFDMNRALVHPYTDRLAKHLEEQLAAFYQARPSETGVRKGLEHVRDEYPLVLQERDQPKVWVRRRLHPKTIFNLDIRPRCLASLIENLSVREQDPQVVERYVACFQDRVAGLGLVLEVIVDKVNQALETLRVAP